MSVVLNNFASGLNTRLDPTLLSADAAEVFHNIDNSGGVLKSLKKPLDTTHSVPDSNSSFFMKDKIHSQGGGD